MDAPAGAGSPLDDAEEPTQALTNMLAAIAKRRLLLVAHPHAISAVCHSAQPLRLHPRVSFGGSCTGRTFAAAAGQRLLAQSIADRFLGRFYAISHEICGGLSPDSSPRILTEDARNSTRSVDGSHGSSTGTFEQVGDPRWDRRRGSVPIAGWSPLRSGGCRRTIAAWEHATGGSARCRCRGRPPALRPAAGVHRARHRTGGGVACHRVRGAGPDPDDAGLRPAGARRAAGVLYRRLLCPTRRDDRAHDLRPLL